MPLPDFEAFREIVFNDPVLLDDLRDASDLPTLMEKVMAEARARGLEISEQDLHAVANFNRRTWLERWLYQ
jgi:hypothetical protein